jgi:predicted TIM-barrel fold metal-dependent hydrolase
MPFTPSREVAEIRARIDHPVIDADGHLVEFTPLVRDFLVEEAGESLAKRFDTLVHGAQLSRSVPLERRRELGISRYAWWGLPSRNTLDRATAMLPGLMYRRLDELGIDFALLYPTYGLTVTAVDDAELRQASARAFNRSAAELYAGTRDRLEPVAAIPMFTPEEALAELEHAVVERGLKAVMMAGVIPRPIPGAEAVRGARWIDTLAHDSEHDYDRVWARCAELRVAPTFHASGQGWGTRMSRTSYVYNHIGNFAAAGEAACRSLFLGGVPRRFPSLRFAFLEGGVAWAASLYSDILGHWEKRNARSIAHYDPAHLDRPLLEKLVAEHAPPQIAARVDRLDEALLMLCDPNEDPSSIDEFAACGITRPEEVRDVFTRQFFFGCEGDDPMTAIAFQRGLLPLGARLPAVFASDIGHWDVPDAREVLGEAWELVEHGHLDLADFRALVFGNALRLFGETNPAFFEGTAIADAARSALGSAPEDQRPRPTGG